MKSDPVQAAARQVVYAAFRMTVSPNRVADGMMFREAAVLYLKASGWIRRRIDEICSWDPGFDFDVEEALHG